MRRRSKAITEALQAKIANLPTGPGVYQFYDRHGGLLYVGKSLNLRRRVRSYFAPSQNWEKAQGMLPLITDLQALPCDTHLEARLLECEQIKTLRPPFNSQMKGDRRYIYLDLPADRLPQVISRRTDTSVGPFRSQWNLRRFLTSLRLLYPLEERADGLRLTYHPLPLRLSAASQSSTSALLRRCLTEEAMADALLTAAEQQMLVEAEEMRFERAAFFKDLLPTLRRLQDKLHIPISIDTRHPDTARAAFDHGAAILNDVAALTTPGMLDYARTRNFPVILMHGIAHTLDPDDPHPADTIANWFATHLSHLDLDPDRLILDPGIGFNTTRPQDAAILDNLAPLTRLNRPLLIGLSRKRIVRHLHPGATRLDELDTCSAHLSLQAWQNGATLLRLHQILPIRQLLAKNQQN